MSLQNIIETATSAIFFKRLRTRSDGGALRHCEARSNLSISQYFFELVNIFRNF